MFYHLKSSAVVHVVLYKMPVSGVLPFIVQLVLMHKYAVCELVLE